MQYAALAPDAHTFRWSTTGDAFDDTVSDRFCGAECNKPRWPIAEGTLKLQGM